MPASNEKIIPSIFHFHGSVTPAEITDLINDPDIRIVQASTTVDSSTWDLLNNALFSTRPDIKLRLYGFYSEVCDLSFLRQMGNVRHFAADCLMEATGVEYLSYLTNLESLSIGIYNLESFGFLDRLPCEQIISLSLEATHSNRPHLQPLGRCGNLRTLYIEGHQKDIEVVGGLEHLEDLTLRSIGPVDLGFLQALHRLWSLDIKLGGIRDLSALADMNQIKYLELWQVKGLSDINVISTLRGLQFLFLQSLANVVRLPDFSELKRLRRVFCQNMNALTDLASLSSATALEEVFFSTTHGREPDEYEWIAKLGGVRSATIALGSSKRNERFKGLAAGHGVTQYRFTPFVYV
jgi:hypothetical protein